MDRRVGESDGETLLDRLDPQGRASCNAGSPPTARAGGQGGEHVGRPVGDGEDLAVPLDLGRDPFRLEERDGLLDAQRLQGRAEELPPAPKACWMLRAPGLARVVRRVDRPGDDPEVAQASGVGEVAPGPPGHQDLDPGPPVLLQQDDPAAPLGRPDRRAEPRGPRAEDRDVEIVIAARAKAVPRESRSVHSRARPTPARDAARQHHITAK